MTVLNEYLNSVEKELPLSGSEKKRFMLDLRQSIEEYYLQQKSVSMEQLVEKYGSPQEIADSLITADNKTKSKLKLNKSILRLVAIIMGVIALIVIVMYGMVFFDSYRTNRGQGLEDSPQVSDNT